jgi:ribosomal protein S18 acetylase RimI-like enzyme
MRHQHIRLWTEHWLTGDPELMETADVAKKSTAGAAAFLDKNIGGDCTHVVAAYDQGLIGFFRCHVSGVDEDVTLYACGTYISCEYRREGLAALLWSTAIERLKVRAVHAEAISLGGKKMVRAMKRKYRNVEFDPIY